MKMSHHPVSRSLDRGQLTWVHLRKRTLAICGILAEQLCRFDRRWVSGWDIAEVEGSTFVVTLAKLLQDIF